MTLDPMTHDDGQGNTGPAQVIPVNFRNDTLFAVEADGDVFIALKPISDAIGLKWHGQYERIHRDGVLSEGIRVIRIPSPGGPQETVCLLLQRVHGWLLTIDDSRIKDAAVREKIMTYKRECYDVLFQHFYGRRNSPRDETHEANAPKVKMVTEVRHTFGVPAAQQLWLKLQLPVVPAMFAPPGQRDLFAGTGGAA